MPSSTRHAVSIQYRPKGLGSLGVIVLAHVGLLWALQINLKVQGAVAAPRREVFATFISPEPIRAPEKLPEPKVLPVEKKVVRQSPKPVPVVNSTPSPKAITQAPQPESAAAPSEPVAAAPPAPAAPAVPKTISSGVEYLQPPRPEYPTLSKRMGEEGKVILRVLVNEQGRPQQVDIQKSSGSQRLDDAARTAALRALFKPHIEDGKAIAVFAIIPIGFSLSS